MREEYVSLLEMSLQEKTLGVWGQGGMGGADEDFGSIPVNAGICNRDAIGEGFFGLWELLVAGFEVTFKHEADDVLTYVGTDSRYVMEYGVEDFGLFSGVFAAVGMAAIDHYGGTESGFLKLVASGGYGSGVVVGAVAAAA